VPLPNLPLPTQLLENAGEFVAQILKQIDPSSARKVSKVT
jgi:hypothetical protein